LSAPTPDPGSFRDPRSRVFVDGEFVFRTLDAEGLADVEALEATEFYVEALAARTIVATERAADVDPADLGGDWSAVLRHERIPFVSYPYEWSFEMLRDAAKLQLDLTAAALAEDMTTKDATSYNVQFVGSRPTFIDLGSFERLRADEPWYGYRQFCQLFLFPLMIQAYKDLPFQPWLRSAIDGITPADARNAMSRWDIINPRRKGTVLHVSLHARADGKHADTERDVKADLKKAGFKKEITVNQVRGLRKLVDSLRWKRSESEWSGYSERSHYTDADLTAKSEFVADVTAAQPRDLVLDLGANDGRFSRLALQAGAGYVVAVDHDPLVIDTLYRSLRDEGNTNILPLTMDLANPSPGTGWRSAERQPFLGRGRPDLVLALAVIHHLAISANVPLGEFLAMIADLCGEAVVEFPTTDDPMVKRLLRNKREGVHDDYNLESFEREVESRFEVCRRDVLPSGTRVLFHLASPSPAPSP
jgi:SAM-dependent methyltransferase